MGFVVCKSNLMPPAPFKAQTSEPIKEKGPTWGPSNQAITLVSVSVAEA